MRFGPVFLATVLVAAACSDGHDATVAVDSPSTSTTTSSTTTTTSTTTTSTIPAAQPLVTDLPDVLTGYGTDRTHLVGWGEGWLRIGSSWEGPGLNPDAAVRDLFSDELLAALDEAGATDLESAYAVVTREGFADEVLEVIAANPGLLDRLVAGDATVTAVARTTTDGETWDDLAVEIPALDHGVSAAWSNGRRLVLQMGTSQSGGPFLVTTTDLEQWTVHPMQQLETSRGEFDVAIRDDDWYVLFEGFCGPSPGRAWVATGDGPLVEATTPLTLECGAVVATEAGYVATAVNSIDLAGELWFSPDGQEWTARPDAPVDGAMRSLVAVNGGVLYSGYEPDGPVLWRAEPDATGWVEVEPPADPAASSLWFDGAHPAAVATFNLSPIGRGWTPEPVSYSASIDGEDGTLHIDIDADAETPVSLRVTDPAGDVVFEIAGGADLRDQVVMEAGHVDVIDNAGDAVLRLDATEFLQANQAAEQAARAEYPEGTFAPRTDWWLIATLDGLDFELVDLADPDGVADFGQHPVASGSRILLRFEGEWLVIELA